MMGRPRLLDLFSGAGGCAVGYHRAGFEVVGVDHCSMPRYPFEFIQADALQYVAQHGHEYDVIHASPVCKGYSVTRHIHGYTDHPMQIEDVRMALLAIGKPYVIENVPGAREHMRSPCVVCGRALGLDVKRHRLFESNLLLSSTICPPSHPGDWLTVFGESVRERGVTIGRTAKNGPRIRAKRRTLAEGKAAMDISWMSLRELCQAIPPAYTSFIGEQLRWHFEGAA